MRFDCRYPVLALFLLAACAGGGSPPAAGANGSTAPATPDLDAEGLARATFAGGCFWCMEPPFDKLDGVVASISGYAGGEMKDPSYEQVSSGRTGHTEVVQIVYDPEKVSYERLLEVFWRNVDPLDDGGQFCDRGSQYRTGIFAHDDEQLRLARASKQQLDESGRFDRSIVTQIEPFEAFYPAEDYHQDFYEKSSFRYKQYRAGCGRDRRLERLWGDEAGG